MKLIVYCPFILEEKRHDPSSSTVHIRIHLKDEDPSVPGLYQQNFVDWVQTVWPTAPTEDEDVIDIIVSSDSEPNVADGDDDSTSLDCEPNNNDYDCDDDDDDDSTDSEEFSEWIGEWGPPRSTPVHVPDTRTVDELIQELLPF